MVVMTSTSYKSKSTLYRERISKATYLTHEIGRLRVLHSFEVANQVLAVETVVQLVPSRDTAILRTSASSISVADGLRPKNFTPLTSWGEPKSRTTVPVRHTASVEDIQTPVFSFPSISFARLPLIVPLFPAQTRLVELLTQVLDRGRAASRHAYFLLTGVHQSSRVRRPLSLYPESHRRSCPSFLR